MRDSHIDFTQSSSLIEQPPGGGGLGSLWFFVWDFLKVFLLALAIIIPVRFYLFQPFIVTGDSMQPNFHEGEYLIIDEISYRFTPPKRGEVIVLRSPRPGNEFFIKRVVGLPGETVEITNGKVTIKNAEHPGGPTLQESYLPSTTTTFGTLTVTLEQDQFFVLGDNRTYSSDSRSFGPIRRDRIVGRVILRAFPVSAFAAFSLPEYAP